MGWLDTPGFYQGSAGMGYGSDRYRDIAALVNDAEALGKSMTTLEGVVAAGDTTSARPLRVQFLHNVLETTSFEQDDAVAMKLIPKEKVYSNTFEWTQFNLYGGAGDGFIPETGASTDQTSGLFFGASATDDSFTRLVRQLKYLASVRFVSLPVQHVRNIEDPMKVAEKGMTLEIIAKTNLSLYFGDSKKSATQFDGIIRQLLDWLTANSQGSFPGHPEHQVILYDAGGQPIGKDMLMDIQAQNKLIWGKGSLLIQSVLGYEDTQRLLFPEQRFGEGQTGTFGVDKRTFVGPQGRIKLVDDPMLRINQPLIVDGPGSTGLPRGTTTVDSGALSWASGANVFTGSTGAGAAGTANFWQNVNLNTDAAALSTAPAVPSGAGGLSGQGNRLAAGTYYYAVSIVYQGKESLPFMYGNATAANTVGTPTGVAVTAGQVVRLEVDTSKITGLGTTYPISQVKLRFYRFGPSSAAPTAFSQFSFLCEAGIPTSGNCDAWDNGMYMPGTDNAFLITEKRNGVNGWFLAQMLPLMRREGLPELLMASPMAMIYFCAPILLAPQHHIWIRNIGRAS